VIVAAIALIGVVSVLFSVLRTVVLPRVIRAFLVLRLLRRTD
jgi:hypothetical protein